MLQLSSLLARFSNLSNTEKAKKLFIIESIETITNIKISESVISFKKDSVFLKTNPILKNEIGLHKERILEYLHKNTNLKHINNIQ